jgi:hypothetical protein
MLMNTGSRATAGSNNLTGRDRLAWEAGIRLFEVVYPRRDDDGFKKQIFGTFAVKVDEDTTITSNAPKFKERWFTGLDASVEYKPVGDRGVLLAYVPDDRWYHNRVVFLNTPTLVVNGLLTRDYGDISRAEVLIQIQCLKEIIQEEREIFKVIHPGKGEIDYFWNMEDAKEFINKKETMLVGAQSIPREIQPNINCKIISGKKWRDKPEIQELVERNKRLQYGWTSCDEFMKGYVPKITALIKERTRSFRGMDQTSTPANLQAAILDALSTLSPEQIEAIRRQAEERRVATATPQPAPKQEMPTTQDLPPGDDPGAPEVQNGEYSRFKLSRMTKDELAEIAQQRGLPTDGLKRPDIIDAILQTQVQQPEVQQQILN